MPFIYSQLVSTQDELKSLIASGRVLPHLDFVLSHQQTRGRGRQERAWDSPPGNLYLSIWLAEFKLPVTWIPLWASVCLWQCFKEYGIPENRLKIKWPNDLLVNGNAKIAGILCEKVNGGVILGIGANLMIAPEVPGRVTSSLLQVVPNTEATDLNQNFAMSLIQKFRAEPSAAQIRSLYEGYSLLRPNDALEWSDLQTGVTGQGLFLRYGEFGELVVRVKEAEQRLFSEEIHLVRKP